MSSFFVGSYSNRSDEVFKNYIDPVIDLNAVIYANGQRMKIRSPEIEPLRISQVIDSCHRNNSIYKVNTIIFIFTLIS